MIDAEKLMQGARGLLSATTCEFRCSELPALRWHVRRFTLTEALSEPYRLGVELLTDESDVDVAALLGASCHLEIARDAATRTVHGIIERVSELGVVADRTAFALDVVPAFALRAQAVDTRFFQEKSVPEIIELVLKDPLDAAGRALRMDLDAGAYEKREYCVQYRESDFDFVCRLLQEEGISYRFEHVADADGELLVFVDDTPSCPTLELADGDEQVLFVGKSLGTARRQSIENLTPTHVLRSTAIVQRDFDWKRPSESPYEHERRTRDPEGGEREVYDHDDRRLHSDDGAKRARRKLEQRAVQTRVFRGSGDVIEFIPGRAFSLLGHPQQALDREHLLIRVTHRGDMPEEDVFVQGENGARYVNEFECIERDVRWRPEPTLVKPRAPGLQTAFVTGPESEEIHTDEHGRIKVRFHWDRVSPFDDTSSCWIRVAQRWSGPSWGAMIIPRIGMEVLVEFLDGDPDRPLVTGCVYNGHNRPPYPLPENKTRSTLKSDSTPGGGGFNEMRFEDAKGAEELFIHAQRDMKTIVLRDDAGSVGRHQTHGVGVNRTASVGSNESTSIGANQNLSVGVDQGTTIGANQSLTVGANQTTSVCGNQTLGVGGNQDTTVDGNQSLAVAGNQGTTIGGNQTLGVTGNQDTTVTGNQTLGVTGNQGITVTGNRTLDVTGTMSTTVTGAVTVTFSATQDTTVTGARTTTVSATDTLTVTGALAITAASITLTAGGSSISIGPSGITITTGAVVSVTGSTINLNS